MINIGICDDEVKVAGRMENLLLEISDQEKIPINVDVFYSGNTLEKEILKGTKYDLIYLDIQMENGDGITAAKNIRKVDENVLFIFVSGYEKYALELFRLDVFEFIKKPFDDRIFREVFLKANKKDAKVDLNKLVLYLGGKDNIIQAETKLSRFIVTLKDISKVDKEAIQKLGAKGIVEIDNQLKIILGKESAQLKKYIDELKPFL